MESTTGEVVNAAGLTKAVTPVALQGCFVPDTVVEFDPQSTCLDWRHIACYPCLGTACLVEVGLHLVDGDVRPETGTDEGPEIVWCSCHNCGEELECSVTTWPGWADSCNHQAYLGSYYHCL